jgi:hypothetical protein
MFRGQAEEVLELKLVIDELDEQGQPKAERSRGEVLIARRFGIQDQGRPPMPGCATRCAGPGA